MTNRPPLTSNKTVQAAPQVVGRGLFQTGAVPVRAGADRSAFLWNVPMFVLSLLVLNHFGRPFEFFLTGYKIPFGLACLGIAVAATTRGIKVMTSGPGLALICLIGWMMACTVFSTWRGGSTNYLLYFIGLEIVLFMLAGGAPRSLADVRKASYVLVGAYLIYSVLGEASRSIGRFDLKGTFGNADDVALLAGFVLPFVIMAALQINNTPAKIAILLVGGGFLVRTVGMTGTRAALPALAAMLAVYFVRGNGTQRLAVIVFALLGGLAMLIILPHDILRRFETLTKAFNSETVMEEASSDEAMASVAERKDLLRDAVKITMSHPIFGVGPGEYPDYRAQFLDTNNGGHKRFFPSHNTYLEVSSEDGIPGLLCYLAFLAATYWTIRRSIKLNRPGSHPDWEQGYRLAVTLEAALFYFVVCAGFMTCERHPHQYLVAGLSVALLRISNLRSSRSTVPHIPPKGIETRRGMQAGVTGSAPPALAPARPRLTPVSAGGVPVAAAARPRARFNRAK